MILHPGVLPLLGGEVGPEVLQILGGDEGDLRVHRGQGGELGEDRAQGVLGLADTGDDGAHRVLEEVHCAVPGGDDLLPVPLVHIDRVDIVGQLVPADGVHVGVESLAHGELVAVEGHALPLGQGVDHLGVPGGGGDVKGDRALHAVQVVIEAGGGLYKQGGGYPAQVEGSAQTVFKQPLQKADGLLRIIQVEAGGVPLGNDGLFHSSTLLTVSLGKRFVPL